MAHQPLHINDWIEIDKEYEWYLDEKARVIKEQGKGARQCTRSCSAHLSVPQGKSS